MRRATGERHVHGARDFRSVNPRQPTHVIEHKIRLLNKCINELRASPRDVWVEGAHHGVIVHAFGRSLAAARLGLWFHARHLAFDTAKRAVNVEASRPAWASSARVVWRFLRVREVGLQPAARLTRLARSAWPVLPR